MVGATDDLAGALLAQFDGADDGSIASSNNKRKSPGSQPSAGQVNSSSSSSKRPRLEHQGRIPGLNASSHNASHFVKDRNLPPEIWQRIFTYLPPRALGNLLSVNKSFYNWLTVSSSSAVNATSSSSSSTFSNPRLLSSVRGDAIWQSSRRLFWPRMPSPLKGKLELDMWRLCCSRICQFCDARGYSSGVSGGQGQDGLRVDAKGVFPVFPFSIVTCGKCLLERSLKEVDVLLLSSFPSVLLPGIPALFLTSDNKVLPLQTIGNGSIPPHGQITKFFWKEHVEDIKTEFESVQKLGSAAAGEWLKGLEDRGKRSMADASRWERWELSRGLDLMREPLLRDRRLADAADSQLAAEHSSPLAKSSAAPSVARAKVDTPVSARAPAKQGKGSGLVPPGLSLPAQPPQKRTKEDVIELKAKRRAEIERRASLLDPPLGPDVLAHIPSFQAALQIISPLDDRAWNLLQPRLLAQREEAEQRERERLASAKLLQEQLEDQAQQSSDQAEEVSDEVWNEVQGPLRGRISAYADEIIRDGWSGGDKVTKKTGRQFAVEVLLYVRSRFYAEVAKDAAAAAALGKPPIIEPARGPWTQKLTLENMKWVFDMKIRQFTEPFQLKEPFLCNACTSSKWYGFDGVIQHYAAKHTSALSKGNIVVHWRAEWPEIPPFNPEPAQGGGKTASKKQQASVKQASGGSSARVDNPGRALFAPSLYPPQSYAPQQVPQYTTTGQYSAHTSYHNGQPGLLPAHTVASHAYPQAHDYPSYSQEPQFQPVRAFHQQPTSYPGQGTHVSHAASHPARHNPPQLDDTGPMSPGYTARINFIAKKVKSIGGRIFGLSNIPPSVKVYTILHFVHQHFRASFRMVPKLELFMDCYATHKDMAAFRSMGGILCSRCNVDCQGPKSQRLRLRELVNHFIEQHGIAESTQGYITLAAVLEMISLPGSQGMQAIKKALEGKNLKQPRDWIMQALSGGKAKGARPKTEAEDQSFEEEDDAYSPPAADEFVGRSFEDDIPVQQSISHSQLPIQPHPNSHTIRPSEPNDRAIPVQHRYEQGSSFPPNDRPNLRPARAVYSTKTYTGYSDPSSMDAEYARYAHQNFRTSGYQQEQRVVVPPESWSAQERGRPVKETYRASDATAHGYGDSPVDYPSNHFAHPAPQGYPIAEQRRSASPRYQGADRYREQMMYRERQPIMPGDVPPPPPRPDPRQYSHPIHDQAHEASPPRHAYEIVEVRDPQGTYYIQRPVRDEVSVSAYGYEKPPPPLERYLEPQEGRSLQHPAAARPSSRSMYGAHTLSQAAPNGSSVPMDTDEYDPRFPAAAGGGSTAPAVADGASTMIGR